MDFEILKPDDELGPKLSPKEQQLMDSLLEKTGGDREAALRLLEDAANAVTEGLTEGDPRLKESYAAISTKDREMEGPENPWHEYCKQEPILLEGGAVLNVATCPVWLTFGGGLMGHSVMSSHSIEEFCAGVGVLLAPTILGGVLELGKAGVARVRGFLHDMRQASRQQFAV